MNAFYNFLWILLLCGFAGFILTLLAFVTFGMLRSIWKMYKDKDHNPFRSL